MAPLQHACAAARHYTEICTRIEALQQFIAAAPPLGIAGPFSPLDHVGDYLDVIQAQADAACRYACEALEMAQRDEERAA